VTDSPQDAPAATGALAELIALEQRLRAELVAAQDEARHTLAAAERDAALVAARFDAAFEQASAALRERLESACEAEIRRIQTDALAHAARHRDVDAARVRELGRWLALQVAGSGDAR
jgi:hypothetical protein